MLVQHSAKQQNGQAEHLVYKCDVTDNVIHLPAIFKMAMEAGFIDGLQKPRRDGSQSFIGLRNQETINSARLNRLSVLFNPKSLTAHTSIRQKPAKLAQHLGYVDLTETGDLNINADARTPRSGINARHLGLKANGKDKANGTLVMEWALHGLHFYSEQNWKKRQQENAKTKQPTPSPFPISSL